MEKILKIEETTFRYSMEGGAWGTTLEGFVVTTTKQIIKLGIETYPYCCEIFGYVTSEDNLEDFVGANLTGISVVDEEYDAKVIDFLKESWVDRGSAVFINFSTDKGVLQFVLYNKHNGFYGHWYVLESKQVTDIGVL